MDTQAVHVDASAANSDSVIAGDPTTSLGDGDIMLRLRRATAMAHARVEACVGLDNPDISQARYRDVMIAFYRLHLVLEPRLDALFGEFEDPLLDWPGRHKLGSLIQDLHALGVTPDTLTALPAAAVPAMDDVAAGFGALYVTEGATLGGQLIARYLGARADLAGAYSYFTPYGDQVGRRWRDLRMVLRRWVGTDEARAEAVVTAALATFLAFEAALH
ncbi:MULTISPECIES: biliverdin-producing heme oxygenase [Parafrankia]|uniref:biliverdin-producing heme oxygenase n=1 Tax=Parafrankia TaxID=2994362 RepID=UPI001F60F20A|nr:MULTISPECIES: biliverdin-producing heme oxygenase [Parafrankia]